MIKTAALRALIDDAARQDRKAAWHAAGESNRVRIDSMRKGDTGVCMSGRVVEFERQDGGNSGAYHCHDVESGESLVFAGCAEVVPCSARVEPMFAGGK